ncbi:hypothetical protein GGF32_000403 [Allomyces javanicus]|nr:hypothetical protein GGF32_000403 [Allomyces javanicus]
MGGNQFSRAITETARVAADQYGHLAARPSLPSLRTISAAVVALIFAAIAKEAARNARLARRLLIQGVPEQKLTRTKWWLLGLHRYLLGHMLETNPHARGVHRGPEMAPLLHGQGGIDGWDGCSGKEPLIVLCRYALGAPKIVVTDPKALQFTLSSKSYHFRKNEMARRFISMVTGDAGLIVAQGDMHKLHRRIINPLFNMKTLKAIAPAMLASLDELYAIIDHSLSSQVLPFHDLSGQRTLNSFLLMLGLQFPNIIGRIPTRAKRFIKRNVVGTLIKEMLRNAEQDGDGVMLIHELLRQNKDQALTEHKLVCANPTIIRSFLEAMSVAPPVMNAIDPNHNYQLLFQDTGGVRVNAMNVFLNVTSQQTVHALVGEYASRVTLGVALAANNRRLWHCGLSSSMDFDNKIDFPFFFRPTPNDNQQGALLARFVASMSWRAVNILAVADPYGQSLSATFSTAADQLSVSLYSLQQYLPGTTDFTVYLDVILASGSKIVMLFGFPSDAKLILRQAKAKGMVGPDWVGTHTMYNYLDNLATETDRRLADGMLFSTLREDHSTPQYQTVRSLYLAQYPSRPESLVSGFALTYYDCLLALAYGFDKMTRLYGDAAVQTHSYPAGVADFLCQIMNIYNNSGRVAYVMTPGGSVEKLADPIFYGGSTAIPVDRPPLAIVYPQWTDAGVQALSVIRGLMILTMLGGTIFLVVHRAEKQIRQLSLPFLLFISLGCILMLISDYILIDVVFTFAYEMVFASAIVKTYRIFRIFDDTLSTRISKGGLKSHVLFRNVAMVMAFQAILFVIWMAAFPVWPTLVTTKTSLYYECRPTNVAGHWAIVGLSFAFNGVMLLLLSYLAYKTRNVDSSYRETSWILHAAQNVFLCSVVIVPLSLVTIESFALTAYFIRSVFMLYAVAFTFMALVGRLIVAVWIEHQIKNVTPTALMSTALMSTALTSAADNHFQLGPKGPSAERESPMVPRCSATAGSPAQPTLTAASVPGSEIVGVYPVLRRGGGLGFFERFTQTWRTTQVYMNVPRGLVAIGPTPPPAVGVARNVSGSTTVRNSVQKRSVAAPAGANHDEPMAAAIPLTSLGFDASPAGVPPGCLEFVHLGSGAAWVVQMSGPEEVASWTHYLKAVASVITSTGSRTGQTSSSSGGTNSATGNVVASGRTLTSPSPSPSPVRANSDRVIRTAAG